MGAVRLLRLWPIWRLGCTLLLTSIMLTGCWNKFELTELGFVMGVAIDKGRDGALQMTTQVYKPQKSGSGSSDRSFDSNINVVTTDSSNLQAARSVAAELGRKAQWSHMRIVLVSEEMARSANLGELLDLFYRDPEPRLTASILITKGDARSYLERMPTIEQTTSQQIKRAEEASSRNAARTFNSNLLELGKQIRSVTGNAIVAYVMPHPEDKEGFRVSGSALIHKGKMVEKLSGERNRGLLMLTNNYAHGSIDVPCEDERGEPHNMIESFEVSDLRSRINAKIVDGRLEIVVNSEVKGAVTELKCSKVATPEEEASFIARTEDAVRREMEQTFEFLRRHKLDMLQIGNRIYRNNPKLWFQVKPEWGNYVAHAKLDIRVHVRMNTTGTMTGKPVFK